MTALTSVCDQRSATRKPCSSTGRGTVETPATAVDADDFIRNMVAAERKIEHWSEFSAGGHFPAMEVPDVVVADIRKFFRRLR